MKNLITFRVKSEPYISEIQMIAHDEKKVNLIANIVKKSRRYDGWCYDLILGLKCLRYIYIYYQGLKVGRLPLQLR